MGRITTVVFDMFNTLVEDGESYWVASFERIVREQALPLTADQLRTAWVSSGDPDFREKRASGQVPFRTYCDAWQDSFIRTFAELDLKGDPEGAVSIILEDMGQRPVHADTLPAIQSLQDKCRIALLSNADDCFLEPVVGRLGISFEEVLSSEGARRYKPSPDLFHHMLRRLGVAPEETVYVGDRQYEDVHGARLTGMGSVWINRDRVALDPRLPEPDHHIESLLELALVLGH